MLLLQKRGNKRGWIRIVEAFVALLLIAGVMLTVINQGYIGKKDITQEIYDVELSILREIELDNNLRNEILGVDVPSISETPSNVKNRINQRKPVFLNCDSKLCLLDQICSLATFVDANVYAQSVSITANLTDYKPRQLKLFCWEK
ncbi:MAG: hypothetical protein ACE5ES_01990 [Candidatus Nanoarchaeia archaeon]